MNVAISNCVGVLRDSGLMPPTALTTFLTGSIARGWAHETSDIDLVVVSTDPFAHDQAVTLDVLLEPGFLRTVGFNHEGRRWEVKYWLDDQVDQLLAKVTWAAFDTDRKVGHRLTEPEAFFLGRLGTCVPLAGAGWLERRRTQLDASAFRSFMTMQALTKADGAADAATGQLAAGDAEGAVLSAKEAFYWSSEALLISHGEYSVADKWRARRFRIADPKLISFDRYWSIETMRDYDPAAPEIWVEQVVALCKTISMEVEV